MAETTDSNVTSPAEAGAPPVNGYDVIIDEHLERLLAWHQPLAVDLRNRLVAAAPGAAH